MHDDSRLQNSRTFVWWCVVALVGMLFSIESAYGQTFGSLGVALTPAHFPRHSPKDVDDMFRLGKQVGNVAVFIYQWSQPDFKDVASRTVKLARDANLTPIVAVSPTRLEGMRGEFDVPEHVRRRAGRNLSFRDKKVYEPFIADVFDLARLHPPYLCLATEINLLALKDIQQYIGFAAVYKKLYAEVKKISPSTKVFVSFQWDFLYTMDNKEPRKIKEFSKLIDIFRPELDIVAFTSYPAITYSSPDKIPNDYYDRIYDHIKRSDEVMFMEIGWPSSGKGSEDSQVEFIRRLPSLMARVRPQVLAWSLLHDVVGSSLSGDLGRTGLVEENGNPKRALQAFLALRRR
jgi:hypothetical protein